MRFAVKIPVGITAVGFVKGQPRPAGAGRKKGSRNKITASFQQKCRDFIEHDPQYSRSWKRRLVKGQATHIENFIWAHAYGKPVERHEHSGPNGGLMPFVVIWDHAPRKDADGD